jgi:alkylation response protein AidB-like acyl-CoA dehydrogenase
MYSFGPTEEQNTLVETIRKYALRELRPQMRPADEACNLSDGILRSGWELGLLAASIPEEYGGFGERSAVTGVLAGEELAYGDVSAALAVTAPNLVGLPVLMSGTLEQKEKFLPLFCSDASPRGASALMEPRYDFDPCALQTKARRQDGAYILDGIKCNVPFAADADWMVVYASLEGVNQGFLLSRGTEGLIVTEREQNMGFKTLPLYRVELKGCRVPAAQRLGGEAGCDFTLLLNASRVAQSSMAVGVARAAFEYALEYAKNRKAFGEAIAQRQAIAFMLAEMSTDLEGARLMVWEAAWLLDQGRDARGCSGAQLLRRDGIDGVRPRRADSWRPRLYSRLSGGALAARRPRIRRHGRMAMV